MSIDLVILSNHLILFHSLPFLPSIFPSIKVFSNESALCIRWPKYWSFSFSISPSNGYSDLTSFRIDWFDLLVVQGNLKSSPASQFKNINSSALSLLYGQTLTFIHNYRKNHSFNYMDLCWKSDAFVFNTLSSFVITFLPGIKLSSNFTATVTICSDDLPLTT